MNMADKEAQHHKNRRLLRLAKKGDKDAQYKIAQQVIDSASNWDALVAAIGWLQKLVQEGHYDAMHLLANCHIEGLVVGQDFEKAQELLMRAARHHLASEVELALLYHWPPVAATRRMKDRIKRKSEQQLPPSGTPDGTPR